MAYQRKDPVAERVKQEKVIASFEPPKASPWATFIPGRKPPFKVHATEGLAKQAVAYEKRLAVVYYWDSIARKWSECRRIDPYSDA